MVSWLILASGCDREAEPAPAASPPEAPAPIERPTDEPHQAERPASEPKKGERPANDSVARPESGSVEIPLYADGVALDVLPLSLSVETLGGASTVLLARGSVLPTERVEVFSTAVDSQPSVEIHLVQGEQAMAAANRTIARLSLTEIPPAPRGVPQLELRFRIDARGRLSVRARDLADGSVRPVVVLGKRGDPVRADEVGRLQAPGPAPAAAAANPVSVAMFADDVAAGRLPLPVGIETLRGENTVVLAAGTALPARFDEVFSTAQDNQASVEVHLVLGGRALAKDNLTLGVFQLGGIPPAPRGVPQIAVSLQVDAAGVLSATAVDRGTGQNRSITVSGGLTAALSAADIERMRSAGEAARAEDAGIRARIAALNQLETLAMGARAMMVQLPSRARPATIEACRTALATAEGLIDDEPKTADLDALSKAHAALEAASHQASRELYASAAPSP